MHWLVEVSRVGDTAPSERYCIDARRWQSALQEARRMRGDSGALPKLTIELTDNGYRAIDPELKVRYLVSEAPPGMPLTDGARAILSTHPPPVESIRPPATTATGSTPSVAPRPSRSLVPSTPPAAAPSATDAGTPVVATSSGPETSPPAATSATGTVTRTKSTPPPVNPAAFTAATSWPPVAEVPPAAPAPEPPAAEPPPALETTAAQGSAPPPAGTTSSVPPPSAQVIRQREERPSEASPIAYRELALAVRAGTSRAEVEALLRSRFDEVRATMAGDTRRFVQLAAFDHVFVKRPMRAPLGTLVWKDWRGEPVLSFPGFGEADEAGPPSSLSSARMPSWTTSLMTSIAPRPQLTPAPPVASDVPIAAVRDVTSARVTGSSPSAAAPPAAPTAPSPSGAVVTAAPPVASAAPARRSEAPAPGSLVPARVVSVGPSKPPSGSTSVPPKAPEVATARPPSNPPVPLTNVRASQPPPEALRATDVLTAPEPTPLRRSDPALGRRSDPPSRRSDPSLLRPHRRAPGEDLIGELFERMHELAFMADIPSGADYVLNVLFDFIPCEAMLVHVFDLGRREFVVVRAHGPSMRDALLFRTPDTDPLVIEIMRRRSVLMNGASPLHSLAFDRLGVQAKQILSGAARHGGRYLGLIEIANPLGGTPFHQGETNAFEYVCEQFADFVASRPLVLDDDLILRA
jgi:hypothetical protein